jgi:hypothetical protein
MKTIIKVLAFLMIVSIPPALSGVEAETTLSSQKKTLEIVNVKISVNGDSATFTWMTNARSIGFLFMGDLLFEDQTPGNRHSISVPVVAGVEYSFRLSAYSDALGSTAPYEGILKP